MRKIIKYVSVILLLVIVVLGFNQVYVEANKKAKVYMIVKVNNANYDFWELSRKGAETAVKELNCEFIYTGANDEKDSETQVKKIREAIDNNASAIIVAAINTEETNEIIEEAYLKGIKIITMDSDINSDIPRVFIGTDNFEAGKEMGTKMVELLNGEGEVAVVNFLAGASTADYRYEGFKKEVEDSSNIKIIANEYCDADVNNSYEITKNLLLSKPNLKGIYGTNQQSLEGIARAIKELEKQQEVAVVGFDSSLSIIKNIENDVIKAVVVQKPFNMGYLSVKNAVKSKKGIRLNKYTEFEIVTKKNMYNEEIEKLLFPFVK